MTSFIGELKEVKAKKTASLDIEYSIRIVTGDPSVLQLGAIPADQVVEVTIIGK